MANNAAQFVNANSEYLSISDASQTGLGFSGNVDFYIACWIRLDNTSTTQVIMNKWLGTGNQRSYEIFFGSQSADGLGDKFGFAVSSDGANTGRTIVYFGSASSASTWYFVQGYHDATNDVIAISVDNATFVTAAHSTGVYDGTAAFEIGGNEPNGLLDGRVQSACVYSAIPTSTVRGNLWNSGNGVDYECLETGDKTNLVSFWDLTEASGTRSDSHGSNDLTDNNTVTQAAGHVTCTPPSAGATPVAPMMMMGIGS